MRRRQDNITVWVGGMRMLDRLSRHAGRWEIEQRAFVADWEFSSSTSSFNPADRYLRSTRGLGDLLQLDAADQLAAAGG